MVVDKNNLSTSWTSLDELKSEMQEEIQKLKRLEDNLVVVKYPRELLEKALKQIELQEKIIDKQKYILDLVNW